MCFKFCLPSPCSPIPTIQTCQNEKFYTEYQIAINFRNILQIFILIIGLVILLWRSYLHLCNDISYVTFNTNLNLYSKKKTIVSSQYLWTLLSIGLLGLLLSECEKDKILMCIFHTNPNFGIVLNLIVKFTRFISWTFRSVFPIYFFYLSVTPPACILCLMVFQVWCHAFTKKVPQWLPIILIILSNDVQLNPGPPFQNNFFSFMNWNVNSLVKKKFQRNCN